MRGQRSSTAHLVRLALLFAVGLAVFLAARALLVPKGFGRYGHFRAGAIRDVRLTPVQYAGRASCESCHVDIVEKRQGSKHNAIGCESCHGPLAAHASDPDAVHPKLPERRSLCLGCHRVNTAKPAWFPQVDPADHGGAGNCTDCHDPHHPEIS